MRRPVTNVDRAEATAPGSRCGRIRDQRVPTQRSSPPGRFLTSWTVPSSWSARGDATRRSPSSLQCLVKKVPARRPATHDDVPGMLSCTFLHLLSVPHQRPAFDLSASCPAGLRVDSMLGKAPRHRPRESLQHHCRTFPCRFRARAFARNLSEAGSVLRVSCSIGFRLSVEISKPRGRPQRQPLPNALSVLIPTGHRSRLQPVTAGSPSGLLRPSRSPMPAALDHPEHATFLANFRRSDRCRLQDTSWPRAVRHLPSHMALPRRSSPPVLIVSEVSTRPSLTGTCRPNESETGPDLEDSEQHCATHEAAAARLRDPTMHVSDSAQVYSSLREKCPRRDTSIIHHDGSF